MAERKFKSVRGAKLTDEQRARVRRGQAWAKANKSELSRKALAAKAQMRVTFAVMQELKAEREKRGVTLVELAERTGIDKGHLSRLENNINANPTLETLLRIAQAIGGTIEFHFRGAA